MRSFPSRLKIPAPIRYANAISQLY
ncbi:hypothetical protein SPRA44_720015 [Serratia proteamaculans]|nr:hypothetical protein SPRA44_720015 [Serratia proteamaculans]